MCGIAGYIGRAALDRPVIDRVLNLMQHRGPDYQDHRNFELAGHFISLLHTRLSIIDLNDHANQPFSRGNCTLIFNGEIYNYLELRKELEADGYSFSTNSDTEVLFALLSTQGTKALAKCQGMWAFAFLNLDSGELILSRDRFGEKPLHFIQLPDRLVFGSEIKLLKELAGTQLEVNMPHILDYIVRGYRILQKPETRYFRNVHQVKPGTCLIFSPGKPLRLEEYWRPNFRMQDDTLDYEESVALVRSELEHALELCLRADVPTAFSLSGGVDSTALVSLAVRKFGKQVATFTVANTDRDYDERAMVKKSLAELNTDQHWVPVPSDDFLPFLTKLVAQHDAPLSTITFLVHARLLEEVAKAGYKVVISGVGADELLSGYYDHHLAYIHDMRSTDQAAIAHKAWEDNVKPLIRNPIFHDPEFFTKDPMRLDYLFSGSERVRELLLNPNSKPLWQTCFHSQVLRNRMFNELFYESVPVIIAEDDLNAMAVSVENRCPFLNHQLAETCFKIPTKHLVRNGLAKSLLREAVRDVAPQHVIDCKEKVGFNASLSSMIDLQSEETRELYLSDSLLFEYFSKSDLGNLLKDADAARKESMFLFNFLNAKIFLDQQL